MYMLGFSKDVHVRASRVARRRSSGLRPGKAEFSSWVALPPSRRVEQIMPLLPFHAVSDPQYCKGICSLS